MSTEPTRPIPVKPELENVESLDHDEFMANYYRESAEWLGGLERKVEAYFEKVHMNGIIERLRGYNPPDRTIDSQRQIAADIHDAADEIKRLRGEVAALKAERDAAFRMSKCECAADECCENLARLHAERDALKAAAEKGTEYVLAQINQDLRAENAALKAALRGYRSEIDLANAMLKARGGA